MSEMPELWLRVLRNRLSDHIERPEPLVDAVAHHVAEEFAGVSIHDPVEDDHIDAYLSPDGRSLTFNWVLRGVNVGRFLVPKALTPDGERLLEASAEDTRLILWVFTSARLLLRDGREPEWRVRSRYDALSALAQMGVAVVGRPVKGRVGAGAASHAESVRLHPYSDFELYVPRADRPGPPQS